MTKDNMRTKIAEACGWAPYKQSKECFVRKGSHTFNSIIKLEELPDYLNDLNAMYDAEKVLTTHVEREMYRNILSAIVGVHNKPSYWEEIHATAEQRAEAFLRTLGLLEELKGEEK